MALPGRLGGAAPPAGAGVLAFPSCGGLVPGVGTGGDGCSGSPPMETGVAAPRLVAGAIAATWLAYRMYVPALAARAPLGATNAATGTGEARMSLMIWRIDKSSP